MPIGRLPPTMTPDAAISQYKEFKVFSDPNNRISDGTIVEAGQNLNGAFSIEPKSKFDFIGHIARSSGAKTDNNVVRNIFLATVIKMFGGDRYDEACLPDSVRKALKLADFDKGKPLSARRIRAVTAAIDQYVDARTAKVEQVLTAANVPVDDAVREQIRTAVRACGGDEDVFAALLSNPKDYLINAARNPNTLYSKTEVVQRVRDLAADVHTLRQAVPADEEEVFRAARPYLATGDAMRLSPQLAAGLVASATKPPVTDISHLCTILKPPASATNIRGVVDWFGNFRDQAMQDTQFLHDRNASVKTRSGYKAILVSMRLAYLTTKSFPKDVVRQMKGVLQSPQASALESSLRAGHKDDELSLLALLKAAFDNA